MIVIRHAQIESDGEDFSKNFEVLWGETVIHKFRYLLEAIAFAEGVVKDQDHNIVLKRGVLDIHRHALVRGVDPAPDAAITRAGHIGRAFDLSTVR